MLTQPPDILSISLHLPPPVQRSFHRHTRKACISPEDYCRRICAPALEAAIGHPLAGASFLALRHVVLGTLLFSPEGTAALSRLATNRQTSGTALCTTICLTALEQAPGASHSTADNGA